MRNSKTHSANKNTPTHTHTQARPTSPLAHPGACGRRHEFLAASGQHPGGCTSMAEGLTQLGPLARCPFSPTFWVERMHSGTRALQRILRQKSFVLGSPVVPFDQLSLLRGCQTKIDGKKNALILTSLEDLVKVWSPRLQQTGKSIGGDRPLVLLSPVEKRRCPDDVLFREATQLKTSYPT